MELKLGLKLISNYKLADCVGGPEKVTLPSSVEKSPLFPVHIFYVRLSVAPDPNSTEIFQVLNSTANDEYLTVRHPLCV